MPNDLRAVDRYPRRWPAVMLAVLVAVADVGVRAQGLPLLTARHLDSRASVKVFNPTGAVQLVGWDRDSLEVRGIVSPRSGYYVAGDAKGVKLGVNEADAGAPPAHGDITIHLPRGASVSVKTVNGAIDATDATGWFYTIAGAVRMRGTAKSIEIETMRGDVELNAAVPWLRARAGSGHVSVHGAAQDVDVSTISGSLDVATGEIARGQFASVSGDIHCVGAPAAGAILDFSDHSGAVEFALPRSATGRFTLSSVTGTIVNGFTSVRPVSRDQRSVRFTLGRGDADVTVRTFKGAIHVRPE